MSSRCQTCGRAYRGDCNHGFTDAELRVIRDGPTDAPERTPPERIWISESDLRAQGIYRHLDGPVEYVRADLYESAVEQVRIVSDKYAALEQERNEWRDAHHERQGEYLERKGACIVAEAEVEDLRAAYYRLEGLAVENGATLGELAKVRDDHCIEPIVGTTPKAKAARALTKPEGAT